MGVKDDIQVPTWELGETVSFAPSHRRCLHGSTPWPVATQVKHTAWEGSTDSTCVLAPLSLSQLQPRNGAARVLDSGSLPQQQPQLQEAGSEPAWGRRGSCSRARGKRVGHSHGGPGGGGGEEVGGASVHQVNA